MQFIALPTDRSYGSVRLTFLFCQFEKSEGDTILERVLVVLAALVSAWGCGDARARWSGHWTRLLRHVKSAVQCPTGRRVTWTSRANVPLLSVSEWSGPVAAPSRLGVAALLRGRRCGGRGPHPLQYCVRDTIRIKGFLAGRDLLSVQEELKIRKNGKGTN